MSQSHNRYISSRDSEALGLSLPPTLTSISLSIDYLSYRPAEGVSDTYIATSVIIVGSFRSTMKAKNVDIYLQSDGKCLVEHNTIEKDGELSTFVASEAGKVM